LQSTEKERHWASLNLKTPDFSLNGTNCYYGKVFSYFKIGQSKCRKAQTQGRVEAVEKTANSPSAFNGEEEVVHARLVLGQKASCFICDLGAQGFLGTAHISVLLDHTGGRSGTC
jgi:hypothetical protein